MRWSALPIGLGMTLIAVLVLPIAAQANDRVNDGGQAGRSGTSQTIQLKPQQQVQLDLSGSDGADGISYGSSTGSNLVEGIIRAIFNSPKHQETQVCKSSSFDYDATPSHDVTMPKGADGPAGGDGGRGGDGGNLRVYYENLADLRGVSLISRGGRGGSGGSGGLGEPGCACPKSSWKVGDKTYTCTDGEAGSTGRHGSRGADGRLGQLQLVRSGLEIRDHQPIVKQSFPSFFKQPVSLSLNRWDRKSGAVNLLAPGSVVDDTYEEYRDRLEKTLQVTWNANGAAADYHPYNATARLTETGAVTFDLDDKQLWTAVEQTESPKDKGLTTVAIRHIVHQQDVTKLTPGISDKRHQDFTLNILDTASKSDIVNTQFFVKIRSVSAGGRLGMGNLSTQYEGNVPANLVTRDYNRFVINLGNLPVSDPDIFKPGADLEVDLTITRSLGSRSTQQKIDWSGSVY